MTGSDRSYSGSTTTPVETSYNDYDHLAGTISFDNLSLNITTEHPAAWEVWFNKTCKDAGLAYGSDPGNYHHRGNGTSTDPLQIVFYGNESRPVNLWLKKSEARIEILK